MDELVQAPASPRGRTFAASLAGAIALIGLVVAFVAHVKLAESPAFLAMYLALACGIDGLTAYLLLVQARVTRSIPLALLAAGYAFSSSAIALQALVFPGIFAANGLFGGAQAAVWVWALWHGGAPWFVVAYDYLIERQVELRGLAVPRNALLIVVAPVAAVLLVGAFVVPHLSALPALVDHGVFTSAFAFVGWPVALIVAGALAFHVYRTQLKCAIDVWLGVSLVASVFDTVLTDLAAQRFTLGWYVARVDAFIAASIVLAVYVAGFDRLTRRLADLSSKDGLTGLVNRRAFDERLAEHVALSMRSQSPLSLLMIDVDFFKKYNDRYGHPAGDRALVTVAQCILRAVKRKTDLVARFGGEEFVVILPHTDAEGAHRVAGRVNMLVADAKIPLEDSPFGVVTVSVGCETSTVGAVADSAQRIVARADEALYEAKENGRNCVAAAPPRANLPVIDVAVAG